MIEEIEDNGDFAHELDERLEKADPVLRPRSFENFCGQDNLLERVRLMIDAALERGDVLGHVLLSGPPGLGKTTLANIIANAMGGQIHISSGPQIEKAGDLAGLLTNLQRGDTLFIDEIHRLHPTVEEYLYPAMEDFRLDVVIDRGPNARSVHIPLPRFTLIGATTRAGMLAAPMRSRFIFADRLEYYESSDLAKIIKKNAVTLETEIDDEGARELASRSRGAPRVANSLLLWTRDFAQMRANSIINKNSAIAALEMLGIDEDGLDSLDKRYLATLVEKFAGGPVGLNSLAVAIAEDAGAIEDVCEPFLIMKGYLKRTPRGRVAMPEAYKKLGLKSPRSMREQRQSELF